MSGKTSLANADIYIHTPVSGRLQLWTSFSFPVPRVSERVMDRWPLAGACPANNKHWECKNTTLLNVFIFCCFMTFFCVMQCGDDMWVFHGIPRESVA